MMNQLFITEMSKKVKRGQRGRVESGKITAGLAFGYDVVKMFDARGEPIRGERTINEEQAAVVRRIFTEYATGMSPKLIAARLNAEGIRSPAGKGWAQSTINGRRAAGYGILNNALYIGDIIWNRVSEKRCPDTGRLMRRLNPKEEWITQSVPELAIVPLELWDRVKARQASLPSASEGFWNAQRPRYLLSGLIKCGECGGTFCKSDSRRYGCATHDNRGTCGNHLQIKQSVLEASVLAALQDHFMNPEALTRFCEEYTRHVNSLRMERNARVRHMEAELKKLERDRMRLIDAIKAGVPGEEVKDDFDRIATRRTELETVLSTQRRNLSSCIRRWQGTIPKASLVLSWL